MPRLGARSMPSTTMDEKGRGRESFWDFLVGALAVDRRFIASQWLRRDPAGGRQKMNSRRGAQLHRCDSKGGSLICPTGVDAPSMRHFLDFEKPIAELQRKLDELRSQPATPSLGISWKEEIHLLEGKIQEAQRQLYSNLTPWQRVQLARHPRRPYTLDYLKTTFSEFEELHGDRLYSDDRAMVAGFARLGSEKVLVIGTQKGRDTKENILRNFGSAHPEGYRKALRLMKMADKFGLPIVTLIDTAGAYPGIGAEERHIAEAIAVNLREMMTFEVPIIACVIGEGGSGGALGIGVADRVLILENAYYSVISPEGCAAILWKDRTAAPKAAAALKITANDLSSLGLVDEVLSEPLGGAHLDLEATALTLRQGLLRHLAEVQSQTPAQRLASRYAKFRAFGHFTEPNTAAA